MKPKVYYLPNTGREVHMVGEYVGVCWSTRTTHDTIMHRGKPVRVPVVSRSGDPYIDFPWVRQGSEGDYYEDDDKSVDPCEFLPEGARQLANELLLAAAYIEGGNYEPSPL